MTDHLTWELKYDVVANMLNLNLYFFESLKPFPLHFQTGDQVPMMY